MHFLDKIYQQNIEKNTTSVVITRQVLCCVMFTDICSRGEYCILFYYLDTDLQVVRCIFFNKFEY